MNFYTAILRPLLFRVDAERAHHFVLRQISLFPPALLRLMGGGPLPRQPQSVLGLEMGNPVGLAAGMDKDGIALAGWEALGFGFVEIGTITALAQAGNPRPRLFRYPQQNALVNRMGFNNDGSKGRVSSPASACGMHENGRKFLLGLILGNRKPLPLTRRRMIICRAFEC